MRRSIRDSWPRRSSAWPARTGACARATPPLPRASRPARLRATRIALGAVSHATRKGGPAMSSTTLSDLAAAVRDACSGAAIDAYEDAGIQGLCELGRFEAAVGAIERVDLAAIVAAAGAAAG